MIETLKQEGKAKVLLTLFLFLSVWWIYIFKTTHSQDQINQLFAAVYGFVALWGASWGMQIAHKWGGLKSIMGRAIFFFSLGLLLQEFGQLSYSYYIYFVHIDVPYPSWGDIGYFGSIPCYMYGIWLLAKASGVKIGLNSALNKIQAIIIPLIILGISYFAFLKDYNFNGSPLTIFLDFGYPLGQAIYVSIALLTYLLSRKVLGGVMRSRILFILIALGIQYISDYTFLYQAKAGTWYAGGWNDYLYLVSYTLMGFGLFQLDTVFKKLRS